MRSSLTLQIPDGVAARRVQRGEGTEQHSGGRAFPLAGPEHRHRWWQRRRPHALGHGGRVVPLSAQITQSSTKQPRRY